MSPLEDLFGPLGPPPVQPLPSLPSMAAPQTPVVQKRALAPGEEFDTIRHGTTLERFLSVLGLPNNAIAGAVGAAIRGEDPIQGGRLGIAQHTTFGRVLNEQGLHGPLAATLGLGLDIALDPLSYTGIGEWTRAGQLAKRVTQGLETALTVGKDAAEVSRLALQEAKIGRAGATAAERAKLGQQSLLTFAGQPVIPRRMSQAVFEQTDKLWAAAGESSVGQALSNTFQSVARRAPTALRGAYYANRAEGAMLTRQSVETMIKPYVETVRTAAKTAGVPYEVAANVISHAVQKAADPADVLNAIAAGKRRFGGAALPDKVLSDAVNSINAANASIIASERRAGLKISELVGPIQYLKRAITPEALQAIKEANPTAKGLAAREISTEYGAQLMRDPALRDMTISEINDLGRAGQLQVTGYKPIKEFFHEDPFVATAFRLKEGHEAMADIDFLRNAARIYGHVFNPTTDVVPAGFRTISTSIAEDLGLRAKDSSGKLIGDMAFPREVANLIDSHYEKVISPQYLQGFLKTFDSVQGVWKSLTLPLWPSYHTRNLLSDVWMITAVPGGMPAWRLPARMAQAGRALIRGDNGTLRLGNKWFSYGELKDLAERVGVTDQGVGRDFAEFTRGIVAQKAKGLDVITASKPIQMAAAAGNARENMTRLSYFIERLARGETPELAALEVKKRLFDYGDLSDVERQIFRRVFPFYSWARNNLPFQIQHLLKTPGYGANLEKIREEAAVAQGQSGLAQGTATIPPFLQRGLPLPLGTNIQGQPRFARLQNIVPIADVSQVSGPGAAFQAVIDQLTPLIKAPAEYASNVDLFRSDLPAGKLKRLEDFPGQAESLLGAAVPARIMPLFDLLRPVSELNRLNPAGVFGSQTAGRKFLKSEEGNVTRTIPDLSATERIANLMVARSYSVDQIREVMRQQALMSQATSRLQAMLRQAYAHGDMENARRIQAYLLRLAQNPNELPEVTR